MIGHTIKLDETFPQALDTVVDALGKEGFGVITRINMDDAFAEKLGITFRKYTILGACNPKLAHKAISDSPEIGLLLPCNVTVEELTDGVQVQLPDARKMLSEALGGDSAVLRELAEDASDRLDRVAASLTGR